MVGLNENFSHLVFYDFLFLKKRYRNYSFNKILKNDYYSKKFISDYSKNISKNIEYRRILKKTIYRNFNFNENKYFRNFLNRNYSFFYNTYNKNANMLFDYKFQNNNFKGLKIDKCFINEDLKNFCKSYFLKGYKIYTLKDLNSYKISHKMLNGFILNNSDFLKTDIYKFFDKSQVEKFKILRKKIYEKSEKKYDDYNKKNQTVSKLKENILKQSEIILKNDKIDFDLIYEKLKEMIFEEIFNTCEGFY